MKQDWNDIADALTRQCISITASEVISRGGANGRILAKPLFAEQPLPATSHAVMDGFALGSQPPGLYRFVCDVTTLAFDEASGVVAGGAVPNAAAGVVLASHAQLLNGKLNVSQPLAKNNIRRTGEEAHLGDELLPAATKLDVRHIGLAAAAGVQTFVVKKRPRVALIGLHDSANPFPHAGLMQAMLESPALQLTNAGVVRAGLLAPLLKRLALNHDLVVVAAESLEAETGPLASSIASLGGKTKLYHAALKPAKPLITGRLGAAQIIGLAGTAYATTAAAHLFLQPMLRQLIGMPKKDDLLPVSAGFSRSRDPGRAEALPAKLTILDRRFVVTLSGRFGQLRALAGIDGFALIPASADAITEGMPLLFKKLSFPLV